MEAYYCMAPKVSTAEQDMLAALDSACGMHCTAQEAEKFYRETIAWYNREKANFCKFPRKPDYPGP
jgi:hypothetical protein